MSKCKSARHDSHWCDDGFPQNGACFVGGNMPICCNEAVCARLFPDTGKPDLSKLAMIRRVADLNTAAPMNNPSLRASKISGNADPANPVVTRGDIVAGVAVERLRHSFQPNEQQP